MAHMFRIQCRASDELSLAIVNGEVILAKADPCDDRQAMHLSTAFVPSRLHSLVFLILYADVWHKDAQYSAGIKDEEGRPAFALVNKGTGEALKLSFGYRFPVSAFLPAAVSPLPCQGEEVDHEATHACMYFIKSFRFEPGFLDESFLWTENLEVDNGFRRIHMVNNADYIFDAEEACPGYGGGRDGTRLILFRWHGGDNQLWRIYKNLCLTVRDSAVVLARVDHNDPKQVVCSREQVDWLNSSATARTLDVALLWSRSDDLGEGFHCIRTVCDVVHVLDAAGGVPECGGPYDGTPIIVFPLNGGSNQKWAMLPLHSLNRVKHEDEN
uniref:Ricin B lectin domain-containing protein n=1 Tax=Leersia perrieri TaxID=77586 RepID=A0A0D9VTJ2_9ORYZ